MVVAMDALAPLVTIPVSFFDHQAGLSALAIQHVRAGSRIALVYHDAPGEVAARSLLGGVAETLMAGLAPGHTLGIIESNVPEHRAEPFVYARVSLSFTVWTGRVSAAAERIVTADAVAQACGITAEELEHTQALVLSIHQPRACAFPGFRQLVLGDRSRRALALA
jgi:hypothetical protein